MTKLPIDAYDETQDVLCWRPAGLAAAAAIVALLMVACSDAKTVSFYKDHQPERARKVGECLGQASNSQDCLNARQAEFEASGIAAANGRALQP
jgi:hypothetical protein